MQAEGLLLEVSGEPVKLELTEDKRQALILAVAHLAIERPGWDDYLSRIAKDLGDEALDMYERFKQ